MKREDTISQAHSLFQKNISHRGFTAPKLIRKMRPTTTANVVVVESKREKPESNQGDR
jgi:hypothetical protein